MVPIRIERSRESDGIGGIEDEDSAADARRGRGQVQSAIRPGLRGGIRVENPLCPARQTGKQDHQTCNRCPYHAKNSTLELRSFHSELHHRISLALIHVPEKL